MGFKWSEVIGVGVRFIGSRGVGEFQKRIVPPSNIVNEGGRMIPRCWCGGQGHGGMRSKSLAWVKAGQRLTDSSVNSVPA
jgi:hypothetical protein